MSSAEQPKQTLFQYFAGYALANATCVVWTYSAVLKPIAAMTL